MGDANLAAKFSQAGLVPNVIPTAPRSKLEVMFDKRLEPGELFCPSNVSNAPKIEFTQPIQQDDYFTLLMIDPDYPKRENPSDAEFLHWLIPNINYEIMQTGRATGVRATVGFSPPFPIPKSGQHRFVILLFCHHKRRISQPEIKERKKFSVKDFMARHNLDAPVAGNFFIMERE